MKTTQTNAQERPVRSNISETVLPARESRFYDHEEATRIAGMLADMYDPEYILLFGSLAGGTSHSEVAAYDLLIVTQDVPYYGWQSAKRYLKMKLPPKHREIAYTNIYVVTRNMLESRAVPFVRLAHAEGVVLYQSDPCRFKRPKYPFDYHVVYGDTKRYYDTFLPLGDDFLKQASTAFAANNLRQAALSVGQAAELFYRILYFVYHGLETDDRDLTVMHDRVRTLSSELMLMFDGDRFRGDDTIPELKRFLAKTRYDTGFSIDARRLEQLLGRVAAMRKAIGKVCLRRINLYKERGKE